MKKYVYEDEGLKECLLNALEKCSDKGICCFIDNIDIEELLVYETQNNSEISDDIDSEDEVYISRKSTVSFDSDYSYDYEMKIEHFIELINSMDNTKFEKNSYTINANEALYLVDTVDYDSYLIFQNAKNIPNANNGWYKVDWENTVIKDNVTYKVGLIKNQITLFNLMLDSEGEYDYKFFDAYSNEYMFIRVISNSELDPVFSKELANAFIFELKTTHEISLYYKDIPFPLSEDYEIDEFLLEKNYSIFPLLVGRGIPEIIALYNKVINVFDFDYQILCYTRVIEYIAPTVAREKINNDVVKKLSNPAVMNPDAKYVLELQKIYETNEIYKKDSELIKLTINRVIDFDEIKSLLPRFIYKGSNTDDVSENKKMDIINKLAATISDTRNQIAHAKANYALKGNECPESGKEEFVKVLSIVARQAVRWFANQPEEKRVV